MKADLDTFIFVDHLKYFLKDKNYSKPITYGLEFYYPRLKLLYNSGGAGYILSKEALQRFGADFSKKESHCINSNNTSFEDVDVALCLRDLGVFPGKTIDEYGSERFHAFSISDTIKGRLPNWISMRAVNPIQTVS